MQGEKRKRERTKEKTSFRLEERSVFKKSLTGPTLLEMSGYRGGLNGSTQHCIPDVDRTQLLTSGDTLCQILENAVATKFFATKQAEGQPAAHVSAVTQLDGAIQQSSGLLESVPSPLKKDFVGYGSFHVKSFCLSPTASSNDPLKSACKL